MNMVDTIEKQIKRKADILCRLAEYKMGGCHALTVKQTADEITYLVERLAALREGRP